MLNQSSTEQVISATFDTDNLLTPTIRTPAKDWMTVSEAAAYLKVKPRTLQQWAREEKVRGFQLSGMQRHVWRFLREDLDAMLTENSPSTVLESQTASLARVN